MRIAWAARKMEVTPKSIAFPIFPMGATPKIGGFLATINLLEKLESNMMNHPLFVVKLLAVYGAYGSTVIAQLIYP